jgi:hypothetical protein
MSRPHEVPCPCHLCHLYDTNPRYRAHWDATPLVLTPTGVTDPVATFTTAAPPEVPSVPPATYQPGDPPPLPQLRMAKCHHLGKTLDRRERICELCWVRACDLYGKCTLGDPSVGVMVCRTCKDYDPEA